MYQYVLIFEFCIDKSLNRVKNFRKGTCLEYLEQTYTDAPRRSVPEE